MSSHGPARFSISAGEAEVGAAKIAKIAAAGARIVEMNMVLGEGSKRVWVQQKSVGVSRSG